MRLLSLDVLLYLPDKLAALHEVARILHPGSWFAFTTWEQSGHSTRLGSAQVSDYRPLLETAGFKVQVYEEVDSWQQQQRGVLSGALDHEKELKEEMGEKNAQWFLNMAQSALSEIDKRRYIFVLAQKL